jgi:hypothetical protein
VLNVYCGSTPFTKLYSSKSRYKYFKVSAKKKDSILSANECDSTFATFAKPHS